MHILLCTLMRGVGEQGLVAEDVTNLTDLSRRRADAAKQLHLRPPWRVDYLQELQARCASVLPSVIAAWRSRSAATVGVAL